MSAPRSTNGQPDALARDMLESIPDAVTLFAAVRDADGRARDLRLQYLNAAARARLRDPGPVGRLASDLWPEIASNGALAACLHTLDTGETSAGKLQWTDEKRFAAGSYEYRAIRLGTDTVLWTLRDAADGGVRTRSVSESEALFRAAFDHSPAGMCLVDLEGRVLVANAGLGRLLHRSAEELRGVAFGDVVARGDGERWRRMLAELAGARESPAEDLGLCPADGHTVIARVSPAVVEDGQPRPHYAVLHVQDLTERRRAQEQLARAATHDPLTGLPNRALLIDRLEIAAAGRDRRFALLLIDLDHFKLVNDSLGHAAGDEVLREAASRLVRSVRPSDTVARLGGDEFVVLCHRPGDVETLCERIAARLSAPMSVAGNVTAIGASIGVALAPENDVEAAALLQDADTAMYAAKRAGRSGFAIFDEGMRAQAQMRRDVETGLRAGLRRGEFHPHFQPIFDLATGAAIAVEALMRWEHPDGRLVGPDAFLEIAEQTGLITLLSAQTTLAACRQVAQWRRESLPGLTLSLNVSPQQLSFKGFANQLLDALGAAGLPPEGAMLEITEQTLMLTTARASGELEALRERGVRIALDDFGTGYSSLAYLSRLPVDVLKADRTFMAHSHTDSGRLLGSIVSLADALNLDLVAEGVETDEELEMLVACGGRLAQGFGLGRPAPGPPLAARAPDPLVR